MMRKTRKIDDLDIPELTAEELARARRITPEEHARHRQAYINTLGKEPPPRGRPRKPVSDLFKHVHMRMPPNLLARAKTKAKRLGIGYQTLINRLLMEHL
jgi:uncharacterized protein (DUF4415 family)